MFQATINFSMDLEFVQDLDNFDDPLLGIVPDKEFKNRFRFLKENVTRS